MWKYNEKVDYASQVQQWNEQHGKPLFIGKGNNSDAHKTKTVTKKSTKCCHQSPNGGSQVDQPLPPSLPALSFILFFRRQEIESHVQDHPRDQLLPFNSRSSANYTTAKCCCFPCSPSSLLSICCVHTRCLYESPVWRVTRFFSVAKGQSYWWFFFLIHLGFLCWVLCFSLSVFSYSLLLRIIFCLACY